MDDQRARGFHGPHPWYGVVKAFGTDHFSWFNRLSNLLWVSPTSRAHWASVWVLPLKVSKWLLRLLLPCSRRVAHLQFSGEYEPLLSSRSKVCRALGRAPMSEKKASKLSHLGSKVMPRPPYRGYDLHLGFVQRVFMPDHARYSGIFGSLDFAIRNLCHACPTSAMIAPGVSTSSNGA